MLRTERVCLETDSEVVGTLVAVGRGKMVVEARRRFEISVDNEPLSLRSAVGKVVGVIIVNGQVRWRLMEAAPEPGKGEPP